MAGCDGRDIRMCQEGPGGREGEHDGNEGL